MAASKTASETLSLDGHQVKVTSLDKVMYPEAGYTKQDVITYYQAVASVLLPQLSDRPVTQIRYPEGIGGERFFQKNAAPYTPKWIRRFTISASPGSSKPAKQVRYPIIDETAGLLWFVNQGALELHTPQYQLGPRGGVRKPDRLVIDLDPGEGTGLGDCAEIAHLVAQRLADDGLMLLPVTSGGKGLHLYAALDGSRAAMSIHGYVKDVARELASSYPDRIVAIQDKEQRAGKVMIDWSQNHPARSTATPYTLRGKPSPTVAAPRAWAEITDGLTQLSPAQVLERLDRDGDLMAQTGLV